MSRPIDKITDALDRENLRYRRSGSELIAQCPAHEDQDPSLSIKEAEDRVLLNCHTGCEAGEIVEALGLSFGDLFDEKPEPPKPKKAPPKKIDPLPSEEQIESWHRTLLEDEAQLAELVRSRGWNRQTLEELKIGSDAGRITIPIRNAEGALINLIKHLAIRKPGTPGNDRKSLALTGRPRAPLFGPDALKVGELLFLLEGEGDAITAAALGLSAIGIPGANGWRKAFAEQLANRRIVIVPDCDEPGRKLAEKARADLIASGCEVRVLDLESREPAPVKGFDLADYTRKSLEGLDPSEANLKAIGRELSEWAEKLPPEGERAKPSGPVPDTAELLEEVSNSISRFVILPSEEALIAVSLWVLHTWAIGAAHATPYLLVVSPVMRSGKTRLVETLACLVSNPWAISNPTEAILFRKLDTGEVTMLVDEVDGLFKSSQERTEPIRTVLNSGTRRGSVVSRCAPNSFEVLDHEVFAAKALFGIDEGNRIPATIRDRSIEISMKRKTSEEPIERFIHRKANALLEPTRDRLASWAAANVDQLSEAEPHLPESLNDRAAEGWEPLFAIADLAGGWWPDRAREAANTLSGAEEEEATFSLMILSEIERLLGSSLTIGTSEIIEALNSDDQLPFGDWRQGQGINPRTLAKLLKPFGLKSKKVRLSSGETLQGFHRTQLEELFSRWLASGGANVPEHPEQGDEPEHLNPHGSGDVPQVPEHSGGRENPEHLPEHFGSEEEQAVIS
jgi:hypothetical protein